MTRSRRNNRLRILDALRRQGAASRTDLVRLTGLSRTTVTGLIDDLQAEDLIVEQESNGDVERAVGRPPTLMRLNARAGAAVGLAIGPRTARVAIADLSATVLAEDEVEIESPLEGLEAAPSLVEAARAASGVPAERLVGAAVALPGPIDWRAGAPRTPSLLRLPAQENPRATLQGRLAMPVQVDNDANLEAIAEHAFGAGRGVDDFLYVTAGEGIGAGIVLSGQLQRGTSGLAGELGHIQVEPNGALCRCGGRGCLGTVAALGPLLDALRTMHGRDLELDDLLALLADNDPGARRAVNDAGDALGRVLADVATMINPARIVIGGALGRTGDALLAPIRNAMERRAQPSVLDDLSVVEAELGDRAGVLGAVQTVIHSSPIALR